MDCQRCGAEDEGVPASCFPFVDQQMVENAKSFGVGDPILCNECLHQYIATFAPEHQYLMKYLRD